MAIFQQTVNRCFEIRREKLDVTPACIGAPLEPYHTFAPGIEHYFVDDIEVSREEYGRLIEPPQQR